MKKVLIWIFYIAVMIACLAGCAALIDPGSTGFMWFWSPFIIVIIAAIFG